MQKYSYSYDAKDFLIKVSKISVFEKKLIKKAVSKSKNQEKNKNRVFFLSQGPLFCEIPGKSEEFYMVTVMFSS